MKINKQWHITTLIAIGLLLISIANTFASEKAWTTVRESEWQGALIDIYFVDQQHGWIVGAQSTILHTSDGGATWVNQPSQPLPFKNEFHKVRFINPQIGLDCRRGRHRAENARRWCYVDETFHRQRGHRCQPSFLSMIDTVGQAATGGLIIHSTDGVPKGQ